jgi:hypothetical protein
MVAEARVRDQDGRLRQVRVAGPTAAAARHRLKERLADRPVQNGGKSLRGFNSFADLAELWLADLELRDMGFYLPTNFVIDLLRTPRGLKWAIPVALLAVPVYLFAMSVCATLVERGGPGYPNVLVVLFFWSAAKFAGLALTAPALLLRNRIRAHRRCVAARTTNESAGFAELVRA